MKLKIGVPQGEFPHTAGIERASQTPGMRTDVSLGPVRPALELSHLFTR